MFIIVLLNLVELLLEALDVKLHLLLALYVGAALGLELSQNLFVLTVRHRD